MLRRTRCALPVGVAFDRRGEKLWSIAQVPRSSCASRFICCLESASQLDRIAHRRVLCSIRYRCDDAKASGCSGCEVCFLEESEAAKVRRCVALWIPHACHRTIFGSPSLSLSDLLPKLCQHVCALDCFVSWRESVASLEYVRMQSQASVLKKRALTHFK